jgi:hypothetical protein
MKTTRKFDGKRFRDFGIQPNEDSARYMATRYRNKGYCIRITTRKNHYNLWGRECRRYVTHDE